MDAEPLPQRLDTGLLLKEANELVDTLHSDSTIGRIRKFHPRLKDFKLADAGAFTLEDAQTVVAREFGFETWAQLLKHAEEVRDSDSMVSKYEQAADAIISGDLARLDQLLIDVPELVRARSTRIHNAPLIHYVAANGVEGFRQKTPRNIVDITLALLRAGAEVDATAPAYGSASTALGLAATSCHPAVAGVQVELLDVLLSAGACVNGAEGGWNPLVAALHSGRGDAAAYLAKRGARLDLEGAAGVGRMDALEKFFDEKGNLTNGATVEQRQSGFVWACDYGHKNTAELLLRRGVNVKGPFKWAETGLHFAAYGGHEDLVELLIAAGSPINAIDEMHHGTPLGWAIYGWANPAPEFKSARYHEVIERLLNAGASIDRQWLLSSDRGPELRAKLDADLRMQKILGLG